MVTISTKKIYFDVDECVKLMVVIISNNLSLNQNLNEFRNFKYFEAWS